MFEDGSTIVGEEAKNQSILEPVNCEQFVKRHMGERDYQFSTGDGEKYSPEAISAIILSKMKADAEKQFRHISMKRREKQPWMQGKLQV